MKVTEVSPPAPPVKPVVIALDADERKNLARVLFTLRWSSLGDELKDFVGDLHDALVPDYPAAEGYTDYIKGAEVLVQ